MDNVETIGLYQLNRLIRQALRDSFPGTYWVRAEIADIKENRSGHCYLELVEKRETDDSVVATARATIWANVYRVLAPYFAKATGAPLQRGIKVLVCVEVSFHEAYGFSLNVRNIDPSFTLGDLERRRKEILDRLAREGVIDMNRQLPFPLLPKTVAVISSPTAAGYGDFVNQLRHNANGYAFHVHLFPAVMQGEGTAASVIAALERVYARDPLFDVVVIIRGGGSQTDLGSFDSYELAANVAQFPLPIIAGIGHDRDTTIVDRVAYRSVKTPTAAAAFLLEAFQQQDARLAAACQSVVTRARIFCQAERERQQRCFTLFTRSVRAQAERQRARLVLLARETSHFARLLFQRQLASLDQVVTRTRGTSSLFLQRQQGRLGDLFHRLSTRARQRLVDDARRLELAETKAQYADPRHVLRRGYSITRFRGKAVRRPEDLQPGDVLETFFYEGVVRSEVKEISKNTPS